MTYDKSSGTCANRTGIHLHVRPFQAMQSFMRNAFERETLRLVCVCVLIIE